MLVSMGRWLKAADRTLLKDGIVMLQPVAMRFPNRYSIYSPSRLSPPKAVSYVEFLERYANQPIGIRICFDEMPSPATILDRSELLTGYGFGLDCWYIVIGYYGPHDIPCE
jgi:hypothetical protein